MIQQQYSQNTAVDERCIRLDLGKREKRTYYVFRLAPVLFLVLCEWFFFRNMYGTDALFGDVGDGRLTMLVAEHWYRVFQGKARIADLGMFYPAQNTLAYSDMLLGYGVVHSILRILGLNIYYAYKYTILMVHAIGTFSCYWLLRRTLRLRRGSSLLGTTAFSFSDTYIASLIHTQLGALSFLPIAAILAVCFFRNLQNRRKRNAYIYLCISILALVLYTSWYTAFFIAVFVVVGCLVGLLYCGVIRINIWVIIKTFINKVRFDLIAYFLFTVVMLLPFAILEMPMMKMSGGYSTGQVRMYIPELIDVIHVSPYNWLLGCFFENTAWLNERGLTTEVICGFSFVLLGVFLYSLIRSFAVNQTKKAIPQIIAITVIVCILLTIQWKGPAFCGWRLINKLFPGGKSIRAIARFFVFLNLPMSIATAHLWDLSKKRRNRYDIYNRNEHIASCCLLAMVLLSNMSTVGAPSSWNAVTAERKRARKT